MILPEALAVCAVVARIARQGRAVDGVSPRARIARLRCIRAAAEHIGRIAQEWLAGATALHTGGVEQSVFFVLPAPMRFLSHSL